MTFEFGHKYREIFKTAARYIHLLGGRGRGGSYTATQYALQLITSKNYFRGYFMREIFNDIRGSLWQDFKDRIEENESLNEADFAFNDSQMIVKYLPTGNTITGKGFKKSSSKRTAKLKSIAGATHVFIEEADEIEESDFRQLDDSLRTVKASPKVIMILNAPHKKHWIIKKWYNLVQWEGWNEKDSRYYRADLKEGVKDVLSIQSTYLDNRRNLDDAFVKNLVEYKSTDPDYYHTMVLGLVTEGVKGRIFRNWLPCLAMPNRYPKEYGLDFGFTNDPAALVEKEQHNKNIWLKQLIYERGMTNQDISDRLKKLGISKSALIVADSAEPKSIEELKQLGWNVVAAVKGPDSIRAGINVWKEFTTFVTEDSAELWDEYENYHWKLDQHKEPTNEAEDEHNHLIDAGRYVINKKPPIRLRAL